MSDPHDIARRIWGSYEHGTGAAEDVRRVLEDAWEEGWNACAEWWEIHHHEVVRDDSNPYKESS